MKIFEWLGWRKPKPSSRTDAHVLKVTYPAVHQLLGDLGLPRGSEITCISDGILVTTPKAEGTIHVSWLRTSLEGDLGWEEFKQYIMRFRTTLLEKHYARGG